jgi:esterase
MMNTAVPLAYERIGKGPPLLLLHGLFGSGRNLRIVGRRLAAGREAVLVDLRNHGDSPHDTVVGYDVMARDLVGLLENLGMDRVDLLGHSMGGKVAMEFALSYPRRTRRLIIVDISPAASPPVHEKIMTTLCSSNPASALSREEMDRRLEPDIPSPVVRQFLLTNLVRDGGGFRWRMNLAALQRSYAELLVAVDGDRSFDGPALFVRGGRSDLLPERDYPLIRRLFPRSRIRTISGAGHWVHADAPDTFVAEVAGFLEASSGESPPTGEYSDLSGS